MYSNWTSQLIDQENATCLIILIESRVISGQLWLDSASSKAKLTDLKVHEQFNKLKLWAKSLHM